MKYRIGDIVTFSPYEGLNIVVIGRVVLVPRNYWLLKLFRIPVKYIVGKTNGPCYELREEDIELYYDINITTIKRLLNL